MSKPSLFEALFRKDEQRKIYDNGKLGIAEKDTFDIPANYSPCDDGLQALPDAEDILYPEDENLLEADDAFF